MSEPFNTTVAMPAYGSSQGSGTSEPGNSTGSQGTSGLADKANEVKDVAAERASDVADKATEAAAAGKQGAGEVVQTAAESAQQVAQEAARQARDLVGEAKSQVTQQVQDQHRKAVAGLRSLSDELQSMTRNSEQSGLAVELVSQAQERVNGVAQWLDGREPGDLVHEVRSYARRRPGTFLIGAAVVGVLAGRMTRGVVAAHTADAAQTSPSTPQRSTPDLGTGVGAPLSGVTVPAEAADTQLIGYSTPPATPGTVGGYAGGGTNGGLTGGYSGGIAP